MLRVTRQSSLYLASANPGKLREFQQAARVHGIALAPVPGILELPPCIENGVTFEINARKKALHYSAYCEDAVVADDSGICVDALAGGPGVYSARYAGPGAGDEANNAKLVAELRGLPAPERTAHYVCVIALAQHGRVVMVTEGRADGLMLESARGSGGFGYDPFFFYPPLGRTFAELDPDEKFAVSHRGKAFRKLLDYLGDCEW